MGQYQKTNMYVIRVQEKKEREQGRNLFEEKNGQNIHKFGERYTCKNLRISENSKQIRKSHALTHHS